MKNGKFFLNHCTTSLDTAFLILETGISANFDVRRNIVSPWRVRQAHSGSKGERTSSPKALKMFTENINLRVKNNFH